MDIGYILISAILIFFIVFFAVSLAIKPLIDQLENVFTDNQDMGLAYLRDIEVLNDKELEDVVKIYQNKKMHNQYEKYASVLNELMNSGYLSYKTYSDKIDRLKKHFKVH